MEGLHWERDWGPAGVVVSAGLYFDACLCRSARDFNSKTKTLNKIQKKKKEKIADNNSFTIIWLKIVKLSKECYILR